MIIFNHWRNRIITSLLRPNLVHRRRRHYSGGQLLFLGLCAVWILDIASSSSDFPDNEGRVTGYDKDILPNNYSPLQNNYLSRGRRMAKFYLAKKGSKMFPTRYYSSSNSNSNNNKNQNKYLQIQHNNKKREALSGFYTTRFGRRSDPEMKVYQDDERKRHQKEEEEETSSLSDLVNTLRPDISSMDKEKLFQILGIGRRIEGYDEKGTEVYCVFMGMEKIYLCDKINTSSLSSKRSQFQI